MSYFRKHSFKYGLLTFLMVGLLVGFGLTQGGLVRKAHAAICSPIGIIAGNDCDITGNFIGNVTGSRNLIRGKLTGNVLGNGNEICGDAIGNLVGKNNIVHGRLIGFNLGTGSSVNDPRPCGVIRPSGTVTPPVSPTTTTTPTTSITPGRLTLSLTVFLHGIGNSGDNANPTGHSGSNKNPIHKTLNTQVLILSQTEQLISTATGTITYNATTGNYTGTAKTPALVAAGTYLIKVKVNNHLIRQTTGFQTLNLSTLSLSLPAVTLTAGDANGDNALDLSDYNMITDCFETELTPAKDCADAAKKLATDLNDDGNVDLTDINLFVREQSKQSGQ